VKVAVLGGGTAGLSSAVAHVEAGHQVFLIEARRLLGGRAWSRAAGREVIENGPHVILGCYRAFRRLLRAFGSEGRFWVPDALRLTWLHRGGRITRLTPPRLPAPLHLVAGLLGMQGPTLHERFELLLAGVAPFTSHPPPGTTLARWIARAGLTGVATELLFEPLCRSIMNVELDAADAGLFLTTLREAFLGDRAHSAMWVPTATWGEILDAPARAWLARQGALVRTGARIIAVDTSARRVRLSDGTELGGFDRLVCALPWHVAGRLLDARCVPRATLQLTGSPLLTVYAPLPEDALAFDDPVVALVAGHPFHFVIRQPDAAGRSRTDVPAAIMAGAADSLNGRSSREAIATALAQLAEFTGRTQPWPQRTYDDARTVREAAATIVPAPDVVRPAPGPSAVPGVWLAGDWTDTGLPSTLEGAARSGFDPLG